MITKIITALFLLLSSYGAHAAPAYSYSYCSDLLSPEARDAIQRVIRAEAGASAMMATQVALRTHLSTHSMPELLTLVRKGLPAVSTPGAARALFEQIELPHHIQQIFRISFDLDEQSVKFSQRAFSAGTLSVLESSDQSIVHFTLPNRHRVMLVLSTDGTIIFSVQVTSLKASEQLATVLEELGLGTTLRSRSLLMDIYNLGAVPSMVFGVLLQQHGTARRILDLAQRSGNEPSGRLRFSYGDETEVSVIRGSSIKPEAIRALVDGRKNYVLLNETTQRRMMLVEHTPLRVGLVTGILIDGTTPRNPLHLAFSNSPLEVVGAFGFDHLIWLVNILNTASVVDE